MKKAPFFLFLLAIASCKGPDGPQGFNSLVDMANEPAGANCPTGGLKVVSGIDKNESGVLDADEITLTKYVCNGSNGVSSLIATTRVGPNEACDQGGVKITSGKDKNADGKLDANEVEVTQYVCDGTGMRVLRIPAGGFSTRCCGSDPTDPMINTIFSNFNAELYPDYDSVVYVAKVDVFINSGGGGNNLNPAPADKKIVFELVDLTHSNTTIPGSQMTAATGNLLVSGNLSGKFPAGFFDLGTRSSSPDQNYWGSGTLFFLLFDKN